jgi:hypothetical protein
MSYDDEDACKFWFALIVVGAFVIIGMVMCPLVINDYNKKQDWEETKCMLANDLHIQTNGITNKGTLSAYNTKYNVNVTLVNPPIKWWRILNTEQTDIKSWAAALGALDSFTCYLNAEHDTGISAHYSGMMQWYLWLTFCVLVLAALVVVVCWGTCCDK